MPEKFIWRMGIALHCLPRIILFPPAIHKHYRSTQSGRKYNLTTWWFWLLNLVTCILQVVENGALLTLTFISSTDNFGKSYFIVQYVIQIVTILLLRDTVTTSFSMKVSLLNCHFE